jgi:hypothetical protein
MELQPRDEKGHFVKGAYRGGPGRKLGSRNQFSESFVKAVADDFDVHGAGVIEKVRMESPVEYLKICQKLFSAIVPREIDISVRRELFAEARDFVEAFQLARQYIKAEQLLIEDGRGTQ